jgi:hypothetical protein
MSAGAFVGTFYAASYAAATHPIRVQPETLAATIGGTANVAPAGPATSPISARGSGSKRSLGLIARKISIVAPVTGAPAGYLPGGRTTIPALTVAFFNLAVKNATITYLGAPFRVVGRSAEVAQ